MLTQKIKIICALAALVSFGAVESARAGLITQAYSTGTATGNQNFTGNLGVDFNVNSAITVTAVGAFDSGGLPFSNMDVAIFDRTTGLVVSGTEVHLDAPPPASTFASGNYLFENLGSVVTLGPGSYSIVAVGFNNTNLDLNENQAGNLPLISTDSGGGLVSFVGNGRFDGNTTLDLPAQTVAEQGYSGTSAHVFGGGSFIFTSATPEPGSLVLLCTGLMSIGGFGWMKRRRAKAAAM